MPFHRGLPLRSTDARANERVSGCQPVGAASAECLSMHSRLGGGALQKPACGDMEPRRDDRVVTKESSHPRGT
jgi:hypothetical protein